MAKTRSALRCQLRGMLKTNVMKRRRETVYRMLARRNCGKVPCFVCGEHVPWQGATLEHVKPRSKGGTDDVSNLSISHFKCNNARGNGT